MTEMNAERAEVAVTYHEPVMTREVLDVLAPGGERLYMDGTVGGGGHTKAILEACDSCRVLGVDRDPQALAEARETLAPYRDRVRFIQTRFDRGPEDIEAKVEGLDGVLLLLVV